MEGRLRTEEARRRHPWQRNSTARVTDGDRTGRNEREGKQDGTERERDTEE